QLFLRRDQRFPGTISSDFYDPAALQLDRKQADGRLARAVARFQCDQVRSRLERLPDIQERRALNGPAGFPGILALAIDKYLIAAAIQVPLAGRVSRDKKIGPTDSRVCRKLKRSPKVNHSRAGIRWLALTRDPPRLCEHHAIPVAPRPGRDPFSPQIG